MKYLVIEGDSVEDITKKVLEMMQLGWKPQGGASCSLSETDENQYFVIVQALIMADEREQSGCSRN